MPANQFESVTVSDDAAGIGFTVSKLRSADKGTRCDRVFLTLETGQIRFRTDKTAPTSSVGHIMNIGDTLTLDDHQSITDFLAIKTGATSGALMVTFEYPGSTGGK